MEEEEEKEEEEKDFLQHTYQSLLLRRSLRRRKRQIRRGVVCYRQLFDESCRILSVPVLQTLRQSQCLYMVVPQCLSTFPPLPSSTLSHLSLAPLSLEPCPRLSLCLCRSNQRESCQPIPKREPSIPFHYSTIYDSATLSSAIDAYTLRSDRQPSEMLWRQSSAASNKERDSPVLTRLTARAISVTIRCRSKSSPTQLWEELDRVPRCVSGPPLLPRRCPSSLHCTPHKHISILYGIL